MEPLVRHTADEVSALVMENELLRYEVIHLRARLAAAEKAVAKAQRAHDPSTPPSSRPSATPIRDGEDASQVREDLVWLLGRLDASPLGPLMRRRAGFRALRERYLEAGT
jgi:hypothetical protein